MKKIKYSFLSVLSCILLLNSPAVSEAVRNSDVILLNPDPYSQSAGGSILSLSPSVFGFFSNPASNYKNISKELQLSYISAYHGMYGGNAGFVIPTVKSGNFSVMLGRFEYNDDQSAAFNLKNGNVAALNYVYPLISESPVAYEKGAVGATVKMYNLQSKEDNSSNIFNFDLGFIYDLDMISGGLKGALALKNIGSDIEIENINLPQPFNFTASLRYPLYEEYKIAILADMVKNFHITDMGYACGAEIFPLNPLSVRVGWRDYMDNINRGVTAGFALNFDRVNLSYSFSDSPHTSDDMHSFAVSIFFGGVSDSEKAYDHYLNYYLKIAQDSYLNKDYISARRQFEDILSIYPDNSIAKNYIKLISENLDQSDKEFSTKLDRYLARADAAMLKNNFVRARKYYQESLLIEPDNEKAKAGLEEVYKLIKEKEIYRNRKAHEKEITEAWNLAMQHFDKGEFVYAKDQLLKITEIDPNNAGALQYLGFIKEKTDKVNAMQAHDIFKQGLEAYDAGEYEKAISFFNAALIASPERKDIQEYIKQCNIELEARKEKEREQELLQEAEVKANESVAVTNKQVAEEMKKVYDSGITLFNQKNYYEALRTFNRLKEMSNHNKFFDYNEQIKTYTARSRTAIANDLYQQGEDLELKEQYDKAYSKYKEVLKYSPNHKAAKGAIAKLNSVISQQYYNEGLQAFSNGNMQKAKDLLEKSLEYDPNNISSKKALERIK